MIFQETNVNALKAKDIALIGLPFDAHSSFMQGPAAAPELIIEAISSDASNSFTENLTDLGQHPRIHWLGNASFPDYHGISDAIRPILAANAIPFSLGGDHSVTFPVLQAMSEKYPKLHILHFDAHADLYHELDGNPYSHACPFARIMEAGLAQNLTQVGIRTLNLHQWEQAQKFGVTLYGMGQKQPLADFHTDDPVYLSLDMDVLDPAFAPGVSHHEPGGYSTRELIEMIQGLSINLVGCDVVEYNPKRDINGLTAAVAAKLVKELLVKCLG